jgi:hypothetical protein
MFFDPKFAAAATAACHYVSDDIEKERAHLHNITEGLEILIRELHARPYVRPDLAAIQSLSALIKSEVQLGNRVSQKINTLLSGKLDEPTKTLIKHYNKISGNADGYITMLKDIKACGEMLLQDIQPEIEAGIRTDQAVMIRTAILTNEFYGSPRAYLDPDTVLRQAAGYGATNLLRYLVGEHEIRPATNLLSTGPISKKTALHQAIERGQVECVDILLHAKLNDVGPAPVQQLLFGEKPKRPLDSLMRLKDKVLQAEMWRVVEDSLESTGEQYASTEDQEELVSALLNAHQDHPALSM